MDLIYFFFKKILFWLQYGEQIGKGRKNMRIQVRDYYFIFQVRGNGILDKANDRSDEDKQMYLRDI